STEQQISILQEAGTLPVPLFQKLARSILLNPLVTNEAKTIVIHYLIEQESNESFQMMWFDELREIVPVGIGTLDAKQSFWEVHRYLEEKLETNPTLQVMIQQEMDRHLFKLYPFMDDIIVSPEEWAGYYLEKDDETYHQTAANQNEDSEIKQWFDRLNKKDAGLYD